jgi:hypothetical protein
VLRREAMPWVRLSVVKLKSGEDIKHLRKARDKGKDAIKGKSPMSQHWARLTASGGESYGISATVWASEEEANDADTELKKTWSDIKMNDNIDGDPAVTIFKI